MCASTPSTAAESGELHVAVGVLQVGDRYLLTRRRHDAHEGGCWEFPGGKLEPGETAEQALARELEEELGIRVQASAALIEIPHRYPERAVRLHVRRVMRHAGEPYGREGQPLAWYSAADLADLALPAANRGIVAALGLPEHYLITPEPGADRAAFLDHLERRLEAGVRLVQLRAKRLEVPELLRLARQAVRRCERHGARLLLNATPELAREAGAAGVHLSASALAALQGTSLPRGLLAGASCHDAVELARAQALGVDYVLCSPVRPTASHPGTVALGWDAFSAFCSAAAVPVYALGGVGPDDVPRIRACGGHGAAGIRAFWAGSA